jgi:lysyl-tRNA synthetase class 2
MASLEELRLARLQKIKKLQDAGINPFPSVVSRDYSIEYVKGNFDTLIGKSQKEPISIAGRVMIVRGQGAILFIVLQDEASRIQAVLKKDVLAEDIFNLFVDTVDNGDFISVTGSLFITERGEESILIEAWAMATKALLPLPDKWHGIQDIEESYRKRYLDITMDNTVYERFRIRSEIITAIRAFFDEKDFLEIETPILQNQAGGAMAKVFDTYHNDYDMPMVLRIALELDHKIIMVGGYNRVYEIGKMFRNEGSDPTHMQEFTMIEWYASYETLDTNIAWTETLIRSLAKNIIGKTTFTVYDKEGNSIEVDFEGNWPRISFGQLLLDNANINITTISLDEARTEAMKWGMSEEEARTMGRGNLLDHIYKKSSRPKIINPTFVTNFPGDLKPLAQQNVDGTASVTQLVIAGAEITNQYAELVNPITQRELLLAQMKARESGDKEAMEIDERFLTAMEHGMPPMTGFGMGIDRLVALFTEQKNIRDVVFFPIMRPREHTHTDAKKKETHIAVAVLNTGAHLERWQELNTVAHLNAAFGARVGKELFSKDIIASEDKHEIKLNIKNAIIIKQTADVKQLRMLAVEAKANGLEVDEFTREMLETTNDKKITEITAAKKFDEIEYLGVLIYGPKSEVEKLTKDLEKYS